MVIIDKRRTIYIDFELIEIRDGCGCIPSRSVGWDKVSVDRGRCQDDENGHNKQIDKVFHRHFANVNLGLKWIKKHQTPAIESRTSTKVDRMEKQSNHEDLCDLSYTWFTYEMRQKTLPGIFPSSSLRFRLGPDLAEIVRYRLWRTIRYYRNSRHSVHIQSWGQPTSAQVVKSLPTRPTSKNTNT